MSHCVPDLGAGKQGLYSTTCTSPSFLLSKSRWEPQQHRKLSTSSDLAYVPDQKISSQTFTPDEGNVSIPPQHFQSAKHFLVDPNLVSISANQNDSSSGRSAEFSSDGSLTSLVNSVVAEDPTCSIGTEDALEFSIASTDEDMLAYLYPLVNPLDKSYSMESLGYIPNSQPNFYKGSAEFNSSGDQLNPHFQNSDPALLRKVVGDMALGAQNVVGFPEEPFVRDSNVLSEPLASKYPQGGQSIGGDSSVRHPSSTSSVAVPSNSVVTSISVPPTRGSLAHSSSTSLTTSAHRSLMNFSYFSRPVALAKASLQSLNVCRLKTAGPVQQRSKLHHVDDSTSIEAPVAGTIVKSHIISDSETALPSQGASPEEATHDQPNAGNCALILPSFQGTAKLEADSMQQQGPGADAEGTSPDTGTQPHCEVPVDKMSQSAAEVLEVAEPTSTASLGCSGITAERCKTEHLTKGKKRGREMDDPTEGQSENAEDELGELKKPAKGSSSKRSRAAEVHNLSERRRRDRINEKMKALQELIPNSNKTDKASMLDEAIEYLKMLQLQLQLMSMRTGLSIPPVLMSAGMRNLQLPQLPHLGSMGVSMEVETGMPLNMAEMGSGISGRPLMLFPSVPGSSLTAIPPTMSDIYERLPNPALHDRLSSFPRNQQFQVPNQQVPRDLYYTYALQQQQQQIHSQKVHDHFQPSRTAASAPP